MGLLSFYKNLQPRGYDRRQYLIEDTSTDSPNYFQITQFPDVVGGGKYLIKLKGNGLNLRTNSTIDVEIKDAEGNNIFAEVVNYTDRFNDYYITIEIYDTTPKGIAFVYLVGEAIVDLNGNTVAQTGEYNVRWSKSINVLPTERNTADLIFNKPPLVNIVQVTTPEREFVNQANQATIYNVFTSSRFDYTIVTANFRGYDRDFGSSEDILDTRLQKLLLNPTQKPVTTNTVNSSIRSKTTEVQNGFQREHTSRFNTIVKSAERSIQKSFLGGTFNFFDKAGTPSQFKPTLPSNFTISGSTQDQLDLFSADIVEVLSDTEMIITKPLKLITLDNNNISNNYTTTQTLREATDFTASITFVPSNPAFVSSSAVSMSYLETTFSDVKPISGEVYRIKTSYRRGTSTGDYKVIYDAAVTPVEYLTDAQFPNQTSYAKRESDFRLIGHFTQPEISQTYWEFLVETPQAIFQGLVPTIDSSSLHESLPIACDFTQSGILTTQFNQNYNSNQTYTLGFYVAMDPNTELELYMTSDPLNTNTFIPQTYTRAFIKDTNLERTRYGDSLNRFGKFLGKVTNHRNTSKYFGRVEFDFTTDAAGLGKPVFRAKTKGFSNITGSVYVSEVGIKPLAINGFSPNLVQFQIPFNTEIGEIISISQSLDFKMEYFDYTGKQSEFVTYINDLQVNIKTEIPSNTCQDHITDFMFLTGVETGSF